MTQYFGKPPLEYTAEIQRVEGLPRRTWSPEALEDLATRMTALLKTPKGTMRLRPLQALALHDLYTAGGLAGLLPVGLGKTIISGLAPYMLEAKRPLLVLPAALIGKTVEEFKRLREDWRIPTNIRMESYEKLGVVSGADLLESWRPDLVVMDEAHKMKEKRAGRTRRMMRYLRDHPECHVVVMTGTFMKHSIKDYAHLFRWALKDPPVPLLDGEVALWADAIDVSVNPLVRRPPGALMRFCRPDDLVAGDPVSTVRKGLQRRYVETAGVVAGTGSDQTDCSLYLSSLPYTMAPILERYYTDLRNGMLAPDGYPLTMGTEVWRIAGELALGFHYVQVDEEKWIQRKKGRAGKQSSTTITSQEKCEEFCAVSATQDSDASETPLTGSSDLFDILNQCRPPDEWKAARKAWAQFVRQTLSSQELYDTELQVAMACERGDLPDVEYREWKRVQDTCRTKSIAVWHDDAALEVCEKWMAKGPGIVWVLHTRFGRELSRRTGAKYYRQDGCTDDGEFVEKANPETAIICSIRANKEGRNLQGRTPSSSEPKGWKGFSRNLITACPSGADDIEQLLGRTHRSGQEADEVTAEILMGHREAAESWLKVLENARATRDVLGQSQKVLTADVIGFPSKGDIDAMPGAAWNVRGGGFVIPSPDSL